MKKVIDVNKETYSKVSIILSIMGLINSITKLSLITLIVILLLTICKSDEKKSDYDQNEMDIRSILSRLRRQIEFNETDPITIVNQMTINVNNSNNNTFTNKSNSISWDEINETFNKYLSEDEVQEKWNKMEQSLKSGIIACKQTLNSRKITFNLLIRSSHNIKVYISKNCCHVFRR